MDKNLRAILIILIALVLLSSFSAGWFFIAKERLYNDYVSLEDLFKTSVERLNRKLAVSKNETQNIRAKLEVVQRELEYQERASKDIEYRYESLVEEKDDLKKELARARQGKFYLDKKLKNIESDDFVADLLKEKIALEIELSRIKEVIEPKDSEIEKLKAENMDLDVRLSKAESGSNLLENRLRNSAEVAETLSRDLLRERDKNKYNGSEMDDLIAENRLIKAKFQESEKISKRASLALKENEDMRLRIANLEKDLQTKEGLSARLLEDKDNQLRNIASQLEDIDRSRDEREITLTALERSLANKDMQIARLKEDVATKRDETKELRETSERIRELLADREDMRLRIFALEKDLENKENVRASLIKGKNTEMGYFKEKVDKLLKEKEELKFQIASLNDALGDKDRARKNLVANKIKEINEVKEKYDNLLREREDYRLRIVRLEKALNNKGGEYRAEAYHSLKEVDLPPIILQREGSESSGNIISAYKSIREEGTGKGRVVTINRDHKFVVIDIGEDNRVKVGDRFNVYKGRKLAGLIEVIQARQKIAACDIKDEIKELKIEVGDKVRKR
ncbi:MAG: hypothetical protein ABH848_01110 [Candidatus Omnitrophota bacterium]